jgi:hypothetical protein
VPILVNVLFNGVLITLVYLSLSNRISTLESTMNKRFDDARDTWRAELRRVEEVFDARLKHLEERR